LDATGWFAREAAMDVGSFDGVEGEKNGGDDGEEGGGDDEFD